MGNNKLDGAKDATQSMLFYYLLSLSQSGVEDPKQLIATELGKMINLSEEQIEYVITETKTNNRILDNIDSCIKLLNNILETKNMDYDSIKIVTGILSYMKDEYLDAVKEFSFHSIENTSDDDR